ncbi:MAG: hypothetical protein ACLP56_15225 [Candidatus Sulfotelmatobacter sp.]
MAISARGCKDFRTAVTYEMGLGASVRDLWQHKDLGKFTGKFSTAVASHAVVMVTVKP